MFLGRVTQVQCTAYTLTDDNAARIFILAQKVEFCLLFFFFYDLVYLTGGKLEQDTALKCRD